MAAKRRILVAEDDADIREIIRTRLGMAGYEVHTARNGTDALSKIATFQPHAMVLDINMPELDGFGVLTQMGAQRIPTLVLTARHAAEDVKRAVSLGAKDYMAKPFSEKQLMARVARLMRVAPLAPPAENEVALPI